MAEGAGALFEFMKEARDFFDGPQPPAGTARADGGQAGTVIDVEATTVEVVDSPVGGAREPAAPSSATTARPGQGFTVVITPEYLLERLTWVMAAADCLHAEVTEAQPGEAFTNAWRQWYKEILIWRRRVEGTKGANATPADYDRLDAILQRLTKWRERLAKERRAAQPKKGEGLPWYVWGGIIVGGFYAGRQILGGFLTDMVS